MLKLHRLNEKGVSHYLIPTLFVAIIALVGVKVFVASHAETPTSTVSTVKNAYATKGPPPSNQSNVAFQNFTNARDGGLCYYGACYYYVGGVVNPVTATGASVSITQAQPTVNAKDHHSLVELAIESSDRRQVIEIGWIVGQEVNGDLLPHLFVYHWVDGIPTCYNGCGFVPLSTSYTAGGTISPSGVGMYSIEFKNNNWLLSYNGSPLGYFPGSLWEGSFTKAETVQIFGEVASTSMYTPQTRMGNGKLGINTGSAALSNLSLIGSSSQPPLSIYNIGASTKYKSGHISDTGFNFGGPGYPASLKPYVDLDLPTVQGLTTTIAGSAVATPGNNIASITWGWGDGSGTTISSFPASHTYKKPGTYKVTTTAKDSQGLKTTSSEKVTVQ